MLGSLTRIWRAASPILRLALAIGGGYGLYILYVIANRILVADGETDPIYTLLGVERRDQFFLVSLVAAIAVASTAAFAHARRRAAAPTVAPRSRVALPTLWALLFANALASSAGGVMEDMAGRFLLPLYGWVAIVFLVQILLLSLVLRWCRRDLLPLLLFTATGALAFYALNFSLADWFRTGGVPLKLFTIAVTTLIIGGIFLSSVERPALWPKMALALLLALSAPIATAAVEKFAAPGLNDEALQRFTKIRFSSTPDIHLISLDALAPPDLAERYLGIEETPYSNALAAQAIHRFPNAFASHVPTKWSLNSVMRLAQEDFPPYLDYFSGRRPSPLTALLHANGYQIATGFPITFMGVQGAHVDNYRPDPSWAVENSALCILAGASTISFFGFCEIGTVFDRAPIEKPWAEQVIGLVKDYLARPSGSPVFSYHHILDPVGHTSLDFRTGDAESLQQFTRYFMPRAEQADALISRLTQVAQQASRPAIVLLLGDHGLWVSRTVSFEEDPAFFVQDRHGVVLAILANETGCSQKELEHFMPSYATPERLIGGLIRCLAADRQQAEQALHFAEPKAFDAFPYESAD